MTLWLGVLKIGEKGGVIKVLARLIGPFFQKLFPEIPKNHPVSGSIIMNLASNMLGLDNAATPIGLKAMGELQELNNNKTRASNSMIMFLVLNTAGLTIIPITIMVYRMQLGAADPSDIFIPILLSTFIACLVGVLSVAIIQRINLFNYIVLAYLGGFALLISGIIWYLSGLPSGEISKISSLVANITLFSIIIGFMVAGIIKRINIYEAFIEGAKEGFMVAIRIIPFLVAMLVAIGVFRASGAMDYLVKGIGSFFNWLGVNTDFVNALPTALMKPLSGSGARGLMLETMKNYGADSFVGRLSCVFQGATDTTFYIIALYFGSVGIQKTRYAVFVGLITDFAGVISAIFLSYLFFH